MTKIEELYNKGLLIMRTMRKHKISKEEATRAVNKFLEQENKRVPDVEAVIDKVLSHSLEKEPRWERR